MAKKHKNKKRRMPVSRVSDVATPERRKKLGGVKTEIVDHDEGGKTNFRRQRVRIECMLDYYHDALHLNDPQYVAALKFREIYLRVNFGCNSKVLCNPFLMEAGQADHEGRAHAHIHCTRLMEEACRILTQRQFEIIRGFN